MGLVKTRRYVQHVFREEFDPSSFGPIGYVAPACAKRLTGLIGYASRADRLAGNTTPISMPKHAQFITDVITEGAARVNQGEGRKLSLKVIVENDSLASFNRVAISNRASIEATLPINNKYSMVYLGYSSIPKSKTEAIKAAYQSIRGGEMTPGSNTNGQVSDTNYFAFTIADGSQKSFTKKEMKSITSLLDTFGHDSESATTLVMNNSNIIGLVSDMRTEEIVGISVTEARTVNFSNGESIRIAQLTDGVVADSSRGKELYKNLLGEVLKRIYSNHKDIILIFGESDLSSGYLTLLAANQGRRFCGVLSDHMHIRNKSTGELELRSLQVTSMHRADIGRIIGAHQIDHQAEREIVRA